MTSLVSTLLAAPLFGLVLAGGKSSRMGRDKGLIDWHGKPQRYHVADLLADYCSEVFISCREDQVSAIEAAGYQALADDSSVTEQYGAILSAMKTHPSNAFIVLACDIPLVDDEAIAELVRQRDSRRLATAYKSEDSGLPEPLIAIWEPRAQSMLLEKAADGVSCPRKALILNQADVKLIDALEPGAIMNVNTPESAQLAQKLIENLKP